MPLLAEVFPQFASRLIRNGATLGGNLGTGSPIGDTPPALLALDATLVLASRDGEREVPLAEYFTGYRQTVKQPGELIKIDPDPHPGGAGQRVPQDRQAPLRRHLQRRRRVRADAGDASGAPVVEDIKIGLGGVAATPLRATATEELLNGKPGPATTCSSAPPRCWLRKARR